jgi:hypothetical protein
VLSKVYERVFIIYSSAIAVVYLSGYYLAHND